MDIKNRRKKGGREKKKPKNPRCTQKSSPMKKRRKGRKEFLGEGKCGGKSCGSFGRSRGEWAGKKCLSKVILARATKAAERIRARYFCREKGAKKDLPSSEDVRTRV